MDCGKTAFFAVVALAVLLSLFLAGCAQPEEKPAFEWDAGSAYYLSNFGEPKQLLRGFSLRPEVVVAAELWLDEPGRNADIFNNAVIPFYAVVAGNDRNAVQLIVFKGADGLTEKCQTNFGDFKTQVVLEKAECDAMLAGRNGALVVVFRLPNPAEQRSAVWLDENSAAIRAKNAEDLMVLSRSLALQLYPNANEVLQQTKDKLGQMNSGQTGTAS
ncbi:MAG: hypothetical protein V1493_01050 [Candidatus Diapherotrites archaeon]